MKKSFTYAGMVLLVATVIMIVGKKTAVYADTTAYHLTYIDCNTMEESSEESNYFVVGFNHDMSGATDWKLHYTDGRESYTTGKTDWDIQKRTDEKSATSDGKTVVFYLKQETGEYRITAITCKLNGKTVSFNVKKEAVRQKNVDDTFIVQPTQEELAQYEEKASALTQYLLPRASSNENVFLEGEVKLLALAAKKAAADGKTVIMLDPGHGGYSGANRTYDGVKYYEDELCLQIANACKVELEKNNNIEVFLTRTTNVNMALAERVKLAYGKSASVLVSLHLNATDAAVVTDTSSATGAEAIYQNGNYNATVSGWSKTLAENIVNELSALGMKKRGTYFRNSASMKYPDGSVADNFAINREAKLVGMPAIIVEHCFINNYSDFTNFLATEEKTALLGAADARGILAFLNQNGSSEEEDQQLSAPVNVKPSAMTKMRVKVSFKYSGQKTPGGYELYRSESIDGTYSKIANGSAGATYIIDATGEAGKTYYYKVRAVKSNTNGYLYSDFSQPVSYRFLKTPAYVSGTVGTDGNFTLKWSTVEGAAGYQVLRSESPTGTFKSVAKVTGKSFTDQTTEGKTCYYKIRSYCVLADRTAYSAYADIRMPGTAIKSADRVSSSSLLLKWNAMENVTGYRVYRKAQTDSGYKLLAELTGKTTQYLDEEIQEEQSYQYKIRTYLKLSTGKVIESFGTVTAVQTAMTTPSVKSAQPLQSGRVKVTWSASKGADGYYIYRLDHASDVPNAKNRLGTVGAETLQFTDKTAKEGHTYLYAVQAYRKSGEETITSFADQMALSGTVIKAVLSYSATSIRVGWEMAEDVDGYKIYRSTSKSSGFKLVKTVGNDTVSIVDKGLEAGTVYYYRVRPYRNEKVQNAVGKEQTVNYLAKNFTASSGKIVAAPESVRTELVSEKELKVSWNQVSGAAGYQVYRADKEDGAYSRIAKVTGEKTTRFADQEITATKTYYYKVRAYFEKEGFYGYTPYSEVVSSGLKLSSVLALSPDSIKLSWQEATGFDKIRIYRKKSSESSYKLIATVEADKESYTDTGLSEGVKYDYKLVGCKQQNGSTITGSYVIVTAATLSKPKLVSARVTSTGAVYVKWNQAAGASGYELYRSDTGKSGSYTKIATLGSSKNSFKDETAKEKRIYYYKVRSYVTDGDKTAHSKYSTVQINGVGACKVQATNSTTVKVSWEEIIGAKSYELWTKRPGESTYTSLGSFQPGETTYKDTGLTPGAKYEYRVTVSDGTYTSYPSYANVFTLIGKVSRLSVETASKYNGLTLTWTKVDDAEKYQIYRKASGESAYTRIRTMTGGDTLTYTDTSVQGNLEYTYRVRAIKDVAGVTQYGSYSNTATSTLTLTEIMGTSQVTRGQIVAYYNRSGKTYPKIYADAAYGGVKNIEEFVQIIIEEASAEGVRADLLAAQVFKETGYLQFGGDVKAEQCNFGGIGAVGGGAKGATFPDVRTGLRAQVQHLKAYGDKNATLVYQCVDPRFQYVTKGCAQYIEWLGIQENPSGKGWATATNYGISLVKMMNSMKGL